MPTITYIDNDLKEGVLIRFSKNDTYETAIKALNALAKKWNMRLVRDQSVFGGYYVRPDGVCFMVK